MNERLLLRLEAEDFLVEEAALLDDWRLDDWLALFTPDARYVVPSTDRPDEDTRTVTVAPPGGTARSSRVKGAPSSGARVIATTRLSRWRLSTRSGIRASR